MLAHSSPSLESVGPKKLALRWLERHCLKMTERFSGDTPLAAEGLFYSTFFSLLTVPAIFFLIQRFGF